MTSDTNIRDQGHVAANYALAALATLDQCAAALDVLHVRGREVLSPDVLAAAIADLEHRLAAGRIAERVRAGGKR